MGNTGWPDLGERVRVVDGSEAHGDLGVVLFIQTNGICIVELDEGCVWPVSEPWELEPAPKEGYKCERDSP